MRILFILIPIAVLFITVAIALFYWAVKNRQFDDLNKHSLSILWEENPNSSTQDPPHGHDHKL
ncbi:MAG: cbb3-type cytochrome oxidase assembly protein CcoS [Shewanellaceae bacterium]|nr:cbb3-type cytochrome oxidase assembly protein CcoS [Shewanellaceae bacterium]